MSIHKFKILAIILCFLADITFYLFIKINVLKPAVIEEMISKYTNTTNLLHIDKDQFIQLLINQINLFIIGYFIINFICYILFYKEKKWGVSYIQKGTALFGLVFSIITIFEALQFSYFWAIIMTLLIPLYLFVWLGCKHFFQKAR